MFVVTGYKSDLLVVDGWRICNVGSLFSVSFSESLTRYSAAIYGSQVFWAHTTHFDLKCVLMKQKVRT